MWQNPYGHFIRAQIPLNPPAFLWHLVQYCHYDRTPKFLYKKNTSTHTHRCTHTCTEKSLFCLSLWNWCAPKPIFIPCIMPQREHFWMVAAATHHISSGSGCREVHAHTHTHMLVHISMENGSKFRRTSTETMKPAFWGRHILFLAQVHRMAPVLDLPSHKNTYRNTNIHL